MLKKQLESSASPKEMAIPAPNNKTSESVVKISTFKADGETTHAIENNNKVYQTLKKFNNMSGKETRADVSPKQKSSQDSKEDSKVRKMEEEDTARLNYYQHCPEERNVEDSKAAYLERKGLSEKASLPGLGLAESEVKPSSVKRTLEPSFSQRSAYQNSISKERAKRTSVVTQDVSLCNQDQSHLRQRMVAERQGEPVVTPVLEEDEAAVFIQSRYRGYRRRQQLRREKMASFKDQNLDAASTEVEKNSQSLIRYSTKCEAVQLKHDNDTSANSQQEVDLAFFSKQVCKLTKLSHL